MSKPDDALPMFKDAFNILSGLVAAGDADVHDRALLADVLNNMGAVGLQNSYPMHLQVCRRCSVREVISTQLWTRFRNPFA